MPAPSARAVCTPESSSRSPLPDFLAGDSEELSVQVSALGCIGGSEDRRARTEDKTRDEVFSGCREEAPASTASSPSRGVRQDEENGNAQVAAPAPGGCGGRAPSPPALFRQNPGGKRARMTLTQTGRDEQQGVATDSANRAVAKRGRAHAARHAQRRSDASEERKGRREVETQNQKETSDAASEVCKQNAATPSPLPHPAIPLREMEGCRRSATSSRPAARAEAARQPRGSLAGADSPVARPKEGGCAESDEASHRGCQARPGTDDDLGQRDSEQEQPSEEKEALSCASAQARASSEALAASASSAGPATAAVTEGSLADMGRKREREGAVGEREGAVGEREPRQPNGTTSGAAEGRARREGRHTEAEARSDEAAAGSEEGGAPTPRPRAQNAVGPAPGVCPRPQGSGDRRRQSRDRRESESGRAGDSDPERGDRARNAAVASERAETEEQVEDGHSSCWRGGIDGRAGHAARAESSAGEGDCEDGDSPEEQRPAARLRNLRAPTRPARGEARRAQAAPPGAEELAKANRRGVETGKSSHIRDRSLHMPAPDAAEIVGREQGAGEAGNVTPESAAASLDSGEEHEAQTRDGARAREQEEEEASDGRRAVKDRVGGGTDQERTESQDHESDDGGSFALMRESEQDLLPPRSPQSSRGRVPRLSLEVLRASEEDCARDSSSSSSRSARLWVESDDASRDEGGCLSAHQRDEEETAGAEREETAHDEPCVLSSFASVEAVLRIAGKVSFECLASFCCDYLRQLNLHLRSMREVSLQREKKLAALLTRRDARTSPRFRASSSGSVSSPSLPASPPSSRSSGDGGCPHDAGPQRRRRQRRRAARSPRRGAGARGDRRGESEDEHSEISVADEMPATDARDENGRASRAGGRRRAVWVGAAFERLKRERLSRLLNVQRCCQECTEPVLQVLSVAYLVRLFLWSRDAHPDGRAFPVSPETLAMLIEALDAHRLLLVRLYKIQFPSLDLAVSSLALLYSQSVAVQRILPVLLGLFRSEFGDSAASLVLHVRPARPLPKGGGQGRGFSPPPYRLEGDYDTELLRSPASPPHAPPPFPRRRADAGASADASGGRLGEAASPSSRCSERQSLVLGEARGPLSPGGGWARGLFRSSMAALCGVSGSPSGRWRLPFLRPHYSGADRSGARARDAASEAVRVLSSLRRFPEFPRQDNASPPGAGGLRGGCDADPAFLASAWLPVSCSFSVSTWSPAVLSRLLVRLLEAGGISPPSSFPPSSFASASSAPASSAPFFAAEAGGAAQRASAQGEEGLKEGGMERMDPRRGRWGGDETRRAGRVASSLCPAVARASLQICRAVLFAFHAALRRSALSGDSGKLLRPPASLPLTPQQAEAGAFAHAQVAAQMARHFAGVSLLIADRPGDAGGAYGRDRGLRGAAAFVPLFRLEDEEARAEATHALAVAAESAASAVQRLATVVAPPSRARLPSPFFSRGGTLEVVGAAPSIGKRREMSCSSAETVFILGKAYSWRGDSPRERGGGAQAVSGGNKVIHEAAAKAESLSRDADEGGSRAEGKDALRGLSESLRLACDEGDLLCAQLNALTQLILFCAQVETPLAALAVKERAWDPACARGDKCRVAEKASRSEEEGKPRGDRRLRPRPACPSADGGRGASDGGLCFSHSEEEAELPAARVCGETAKPWEGRGGGRRSASAGQKEVQRTRPRPCEHTRQARRLAPAAPSEGDEADSAEEDTAERLSWRAELRSGFAREASRLAGLAQALKDRLVWLITAEALQMIKSHSCVLYVPLADVFGSLLSPSRLSAAPSLLSASLRLLPQCGAAVWDAAWTRVGQALVHAVLHTSFSSRDVSSPLWPFFARDEDPQVGGSASFLPSLIGTAGGPSRFPRALARFASTARVLLVAYFTAPPSSLAPAFAGRMSSGLSPSSPAGSGLHDGEARRGRSCFSVLSIHRSVALLQDLEAFLRAPADRVVSPLSHILKSHFPCFSHAFPAGASEESSRWLLSPAASLVATSVPPTPAGHSGAWGRHAAAAGARQNGSEVRLGSLPRASTSPWASCLPFGLECRRGAPTDANLAAASRADPRPAREDEERGAGADWGRWRQPERRARGASPSKGSAKLLEASLAKEVQAARVVESLLRCGLKAEKFAADLLRLRPDLPRPAQEAVLAEVCDALACGRRQAAHALAEARRARAVVETLCGRGDSEGRAPGSSCESEATWEDRQPEAAARGESTCARKGRGEKTTQASRSQPCAAQDGRPLSAVDQQPTANAAEMTAGGGAPSGEAAVQQWERTKETLMTVAETAPDRPATEKEGEEIDRSGTRGRSAHGGAEQRRKEARLSLVRLREAQAAVATMRHRSDASKEDRGEANEGDLTPAQRPGAEREEALHAWSPPHLEERDTPMAWSAAAGNAKHRDVGGDREARSGISSPAAKDEETSENGICESACSCLNEDTFSSSAGFPARSASDPVVKGSGPAAFLPSPCSMPLSAASPVSSHLASRSTMAALSSPLSVAPLPSPGGQARARGPKSPKSPFPDEHEPAASSASPASSSSEGGLPWCIASASPARRPPRPGPAGSLSSLSTTGCHSGDSRASTAEVVGPSPRRGDAPEGPEGPRRAEGEFRAAETQVEEHRGSPWAGGERGEVAVAAKTGRCSVQPGVEASKGASSAVSPALRRAWGWMWRSREENERRAKAVASSIVAPLLAALAPKAGGTPERMNVPTSVFSQLSFSDSEEDSATDPSSEEESEQCHRPDFDTRSGEELYGEAPGAEQEGRAREKARLLGKAPTGRDEEEKHTWAGYPASAVLPRGRDSHVTSRRTHAGSPSWRANAGREEEEEAAEAAGVPVHFARRETRQSTAERDEACDFPRKSLAGFVWHRGTLPPGAAALLPSPFASFFAHMQASTDSPSPSHALALFLAASPFVSSLASSSEACGLPASSAEKEESGRWCAGPALPGATGRERLAPGRQPQEAREGATEEDEGLHRKWWRLDGPLLRISSCPSELFPEAALHLSDLCCVLEADEGSEATDGGREEGRGCQGCARCRPTLAATAASVARRVGAATQKRGRGAGEAGPADLGLAQGEQDDEGETLWHELEYEWVEAQEAVTKNPSCRLVLTFWDGVRAPVVVFFSSPRRRRLWAQTLSAGIASASACLWRRGISAGASLSDVASPGCFSSSVSLSSSSSPSSGGGGGATRSSLPSSCVPEMPPQTRGRGRKPIRERLARASGDGGQENGVDSWTRPSMGRGRPRASSSSSSVKETRQPFPRSASAFRRPTGPCFFVYSERPYAKSGGTVFYFPSPLFFSLFSKPASQGVTSSLPRPALDPRHPSVCEDRDEESASSSPLSASAEGASHSCVVAEALHQFRSLLGLQRPRGLFCTLRSASEARGASPRRKGGGSASWGGGSASWPSRERRASPRGGEAHAERGLPEGRGQLGEGRGLPRKGRHEPGGEAAESRESSRLSQSGARRSWGTPAPSMCLRSQLVAGGGESEFVMPDSPPRVRASELCPPHTDTPAEGEADSGWVFVEETLHRSGLVPDDGDDTSSLSPSSSLAALHVLGL